MDNIYTVNDISDILFPIFKDYKIKKAVLFGSYADGKADLESDIDILVDSELKGLGFVGFIEDVRHAVKKEVDVFDTSHINKGSLIEQEINQKGKVIYEG